MKYASGSGWYFVKYDNIINKALVQSICVDVCLQVSMGFGSDARSYMISGNWDPTDPHFEVLNIETAKGL